MTIHLITANDFLNSGLPVSDDIRDEEVTFAIKTVEKNYIRPLVGAELYKAMVQNPTEYTNLLNETTDTNGIRHAEYEMVFAILLYDRFRLTRYSTVIKDDEHSSDPSESDIMSICSLHWENALTTIIDTLVSNSLEPSTNIVNQPPFFELAFPVYRKERRD